MIWKIREGGFPPSRRPTPRRIFDSTNAVFLKEEGKEEGID